MEIFCGSSVQLFFQFRIIHRKNINFIRIDISAQNFLNFHRNSFSRNAGYNNIRLLGQSFIILHLHIKLWHIHLCNTINIRFIKETKSKFQCKCRWNIVNDHQIPVYITRYLIIHSFQWSHIYQKYQSLICLDISYIIIHFNDQIFRMYLYWHIKCFIDIIADHFICQTCHAWCAVLSMH